MKPLKADDLLANAPPPPIKSAVKHESKDEVRSTVYTNGNKNVRIKSEVKDEPLDEDFFLDTDDLPRECNDCSS